MNLRVAVEPGDGSHSRLKQASARSGQILGGVYRLQECIGHGGMGEVYAAQNLRLGRRLAVKIVRVGATPKAVDRFRREAEALARIDNEYVVNVFDCGELDEQTPYIVMELLQGQDLRRLLDAASPLPIPRAVSLVWEACHGLAAVHDAGLIHRDLKPENLFVCKRATGEDWCKVLDFGVAKQEFSNSTVEGALIGTIRYMAPEQLRDATSVSSRSDIYGLGAILYECIAGTSPHSGGASHELMFRIMNEGPLPLDRRRAGVPAELARIVARCLSKDPEKRYADARALAAALGPFTRPGGAFLHAQLDTAELDRRPERARPFRAAGAFLGIGFLGGAVACAAVFWSDLARPKASAPNHMPVQSRASAAPAPVPAPREELTAITPPVRSASAVAPRRDLVSVAANLRAISLSSKARPMPNVNPAATIVPPSVGTPMPTAHFDSSNPYAR